MISWLQAAVPLVSIDFELEPHEQVELILWLIVAAISLIPIVIFFISYIRIKSMKLLITTLAFFLFFAKGMILSMKLFVTNYVDAFWWTVAAIMDLIIIALITYSLSKKD
jgi:hypothetical protein